MQIDEKTNTHTHTHTSTVAYTYIVSYTNCTLSLYELLSFDVHLFMYALWSVIHKMHLLYMVYVNKGTIGRIDWAMSAKHSNVSNLCIDIIHFDSCLFNDCPNGFNLLVHSNHLAVANINYADFLWLLNAPSYLF